MKSIGAFFLDGTRALGDGLERFRDACAALNGKGAENPPLPLLPFDVTGLKPTAFAVINLPPTLHPMTRKLVCDFAEALGRKLHIAELKYGYSDGWNDPRWMNKCRRDLKRHVEKGDPLDVAAYCAFLWHHRAPTNGRKRRPAA